MSDLSTETGYLFPICFLKLTHPNGVGIFLEEQSRASIHSLTKRDRYKCSSLYSSSVEIIWAEALIISITCSTNARERKSTPNPFNVFDDMEVNNSPSCLYNE